MIDWLYLVNTVWPILAFVGTLAIGGFTYWLKSNVPMKSAHDLLSEKVDTQELSLAKYDQRIGQLENFKDHEPRLVLVERHISDSPTRSDIQRELSAVKADVEGVKSEVEIGFRGMEIQMATLNGFLQILTGKAIPGVKS